MTHVLTLIANPASRPLDTPDIALARAVLPHLASAPDWLSEGEACDIRFTPDTDEPDAALTSKIRAALGEKPVDVVCQRVHKRRKRLLVADMDSTLIGQECIDEIADLLGIKAKVAAITERAMRGELAFEAALRERVALLKGLEETALESLFEERITLNEGARALACTMRANGAHTVIVSGGFTIFTARVAEQAVFNAHHANELEIRNGKLTGRVIEPILGQQAKLDALRRHSKSLGLTRQETLGLGDGANDLAMIAEAGLGVAYHAKPIVAAEADARIDHGDLTAVLFAQGYRRGEFVC
ncbi:MAG: phosphoserine phosphatase SerB [Methyloligellaceae bacterium]